MKTIIETAMQNPEFSTLMTAITAAGLVDTLSGTGPFTVFAPNNAAFAKLPPATLTDLLANKEKLSTLLTGHVLTGTILSKDIASMKKATTLADSALTINTEHGVTINNAKVVQADVVCSNGVIHVIDTVLTEKAA